MSTTYEDILQLFREVAEAQKETERKSQETDRKFQETERLMKEQSQETDRKLQELARTQKETDRLLREQIGKLGNRLGEFVEGLVQPAVVRLFQARGIAFHEVHTGVEVDRHDDGLEIDLLVVNDTEAVLVEVKSKLTQADVEEHLERLGKFKRLMPRYANVRALGAVAAMVIPREIGRYAYRQGLFVLAQSGQSVVILNDDKFQPKAW